MRWGLPFVSLASVLLALLWLQEERGPLGAVILIFAIGLYAAIGDRRPLGLTIRPRQGWWMWIRIGLVLGVMLFILMLAGLYYSGMQSTTQLRNLASIEFFWRGVVGAPLLEEPIYRLLLCVPLVPLLGARATVIVSGLVFAHMHFHFGVLGPDNAIAGYFLAWSYIKSECLLVPILYHAFGNGILSLAALTLLSL